MTRSVALPHLKTATASTRDAVIVVLSNNWPLSAKQIYNEIIRGNGSNISYQAAYKTIQQMFEEGVLERKERNYLLNSKWINKVKKFGSTLEEAYLNNKKFSFEELQKKESFSLTFNTFMEMAHFILGFLYSFPNPEKKEGICQCYHSWGVVGASEEEYSKLKKILSDVQYYELVKNTTPLDYVFSEFARKLGKKVKVGADCASNCDVVIKGDYVAQIYFPEDLKNAIKEIYGKTNSLQELDMNEMFKNALEKKTEIEVAVIKNGKVADRLREETLTYFKEDAK